ncbi:DUF6241 domain-containing protein [Lederbergia lenta]|uniref:DUF6241 domain-containing protein n=1 Tax=Lederbergia lenta TaxID=1467 RepID=UPI00203D24D5|nr:DUF6241 domain-containing protein [Lederbergia lenta]MCM3113054.1 DUF6241 domain-containing protein [Lederbergia lenta]
MKNKKIIIITFGAVLFAIVTYLTFTLLNNDKNDVTVKEKTAITKSGGNTQVETSVIEIDEQREETIEEEFPNDTSEYAIQDAIHGMSHQKVIAEEKWGFLPLTQERVKRLIEVVEMNESKYIHASTYLRILERWENNDFTQADKDHNAVWKLQGGTIGKASGVLSLDEEKAFIKKHFNIKAKAVTSESN